MKRIVLVLTFVLVLGVGTIFAFAETSGYTESDGWARDRMEYHRELLKNDRENNQITEEQYKTWSEHYDYMEEFHAENGYYGMSDFGGCHGRSRNNNNRSFNGGGMMRRGF